jgi:putative transposase
VHHQQPPCPPGLSQLGAQPAGDGTQSALGGRSDLHWYPEWLCLSCILLDLFARRVVGYVLSRRIDTALCLEALRVALIQRKPPAGIIHHSNRGVQYASGDSVDVLNQHGFRISMAHKGNPYANAAAESFIKTLKSEEVYLWEYQTLNDVQNRLPSFLEEVYNHKRLHSLIGYVPPVEFEETFYQTNPVRLP